MSTFKTGQCKVVINDLTDGVSLHEILKGSYSGLYQYA